MKTLLCAAALAACFPVFAQTAAPPDQGAAAQLDPMLVTATRTPLGESDALADVTVITRQQIEQSQVTDITDLLRYEAGIDIGRNGGPGQFTSVFLNGGNSDQTLVLVDGVRINPATAGGAALQNITPDMIERIEIVKGPSATLYGSDAVAGVINIITRGGTHSGVDLHARAGSDNTKAISGQLSYNGNGNQLSLLAQNETTDGIPPCAGSGDVPGGYRQSTIHFNGSTQAGPVQLGARFWNAQGNAQYNIACGFGSTPTSQNFRNQVAAVDVGGRPLANWQSTLTASRTQSNIVQNLANADGSHDFTTTTQPQLDWHNVLALGAIHRLSFGAQATQEKVQELSFGTAVNTGYDYYSGFVQDELNSGRQHARLAGSVVKYTTFGSHASWNAEYGYDLFKATRLIATSGTGFHAPNADDLYGFGGNPQLKPEETHSYELGLRQQLGSHQVVDLRAFRRDTSNLIQLVPPNYTAVNIDRARTQGVELGYRLELAQWSARVNAITQNPKDLNAGTPLLRRAHQSLSGQLTRRFGKNYLGVEALASGPRPDGNVSTGAPLTDGGYTLFALTGGLQLSEAFSLLARVDNVLDKHYQTANGYNEPGSTVMVTLRYAE